MSSLIAALAAALLLAAQHPSMPQGMSHEEHLKQIQKDEELNKRGGESMGFDQDAVTHHFRLTPDGGSIEITVKSAKDATTIAAIRSHLQTIAGDFSRGQFGKPVQTHGEVPPGRPGNAQEQSTDRISIRRTARRRRRTNRHQGCEGDGGNTCIPALSNNGAQDR